MRRSTRLEQIEELLLQHPDGMRVMQISKHCNVDRRTIYRDLETMHDMGVPLWQANGRYGIEREQYHTSVRINLNEAFTALWSLRLLGTTLKLFNPHAQSLAQKLGETFQKDIAEQIHAVNAVYHAAQKENDDYVHVIEDMIRAWADRIMITIWLRGPFKKSIKRRIAPYMLDTTPTGKPYVVALDEKSREIRVYTLPRIHKTQVHPELTFSQPHNFDVAQYTAAMQDYSERSQPNVVVLRFKKTAFKALSEKNWYPKQRIERMADGSALYTAETSNWHELEKWVRSWGADVEVIAPASFRETIAAEYRQAVKQYR